MFDSLVVRTWCRVLLSFFFVASVHTGMARKRAVGDKNDGRAN